MATKNQQTAFDLLGKRWSALIVRELIQGPRRFRELLTAVGSINDKVLSQRLKELEARGIVERRVFAEVPVQVEYSLSEKGRGLAAVIQAMEQWDSAWANSNGSANRTSHSPAAAPVEAPNEARPPQAVASAEPRPVKVPFWKRVVSQFERSGG